MAGLTVTLPQALLDYVTEQLDAGQFADASDYVRTLIRRDQEARDALWAAIEEGEASGVSDLTPEQVFERARERHRSHAA